MADSTGEEITTTEENIEPSEKEQPEPMEEEQSKAEVEEEAPKATENGHQAEEVSSGVVENDKQILQETDEIPKKTDEIPKQTDKIPEETDEVAKEADNNEAAEDKASGDIQQKKSEGPKEVEKGHGSTVAKHYNEHKENTREERKTSRIFYLRNFNNWVKSVLINEFMEKYKRKTFRDLCVLDLACGKGGDLLKWQKARISNLVCADIAEVSMKQCEQRYKDLRYGRNHRRYNQQTRVYDAQFITADCSKEDLSKKYHGRNRDVKFDMASCQFSLHYAFESLEQAERMVQNACERIKPGGYFIGTVPCANEIINRLRQSEDMSFENECYKISFTEKEKFSLFGHKYDFHLEGVVDCPEFLVYFPLLEKIAKKFGMTLELAQGFHQFFEEHKDKEEYKFLLNKMNSLETYPPRREGEQPISEKEDAYTQAKEVLGAGKDGEDKKLSHVGTLSKDEWEAAGLYMVFAFKKAEPEPKPSPMEVEKIEVAKTEQSEPNTDDKHDETVKEDNKVEEQDTETKMDEGDERPEGDKKLEAADEMEEETDKIDEDTDKTEEFADKKEEDADKKEKDAEREEEDADKKEEDADKKEEDADKKEEDVDEDEVVKKDQDADKKVEEIVKKDEDAAEKDENVEDADKKDEGEKVAVADSTEAEQGGETGEQVSEDTTEEKKQTPQRGRRKRSAGAAKEEAIPPEEATAVAPKRGARKRKSTGGGEEEPPEKKKA